AREDDVSLDRERWGEGIAREEVRAVVLAGPDERRVRQTVGVEADRVLEHMPASALAFRGGDVRARVHRARGEAFRPRDRPHTAQERESQPVGRRLVRRARGPSATAPRVCAAAIGGSTHSARGAGGATGRRTTANWLSARTHSPGSETGKWTR